MYRRNQWSRSAEQGQTGGHTQSLLSVGSGSKQQEPVVPVCRQGSTGGGGAHIVATGCGQRAANSRNQWSLFERVAPREGYAAGFPHVPSSMCAGASEEGRGPPNASDTHPACKAGRPPLHPGRCWRQKEGEKEKKKAPAAAPTRADDVDHHRQRLAQRAQRQLVAPRAVPAHLPAAGGAGRQACRSIRQGGWLSAPRRTT